MKHLNFANLIALTLWVCIGFVIFNTVTALAVLNSTPIRDIIGQ